MPTHSGIHGWKFNEFIPYQRFILMFATLRYTTAVTVIPSASQQRVHTFGAVVPAASSKPVDELGHLP